MTCDPNNRDAKFCTGSRIDSCCHPIEFHDMDVGCTYRVESTTSEDHWICGCKCVICIHRNLLKLQAERKAILIQEQQEIEAILSAKAELVNTEIVVQEEAKVQDGRVF